MKLRNTRVLLKVLPDYPVVVVVGLGSIKAAFNELDELHEKKENVRKAIAAAVSTIRSLETSITEIHFDSCEEAESVAIGAIVSDWRFDEFKSESLKRKPLKFQLADQTNSKDLQSWQVGFSIASFQNACRRLQELPANILTPTK